ncbi:MAG: MgtC/SapB family protein [Phycisphaerales bacterium]|nr:MgtC/SapB family protein [Phycisphaerales bacterium]
MMMLTPFTLADMQWDTTGWDAALRLVVAGLCAALIGWDREVERRAAGLRTHVLVALGAAGFTLIACEFLETLAHTDTAFAGDPTRIIASIVGGIGFLGAGAIMQSGGKVHGLTTAAGLWAIAAVGIASGLGLFALALTIALLAFITLTLLRRIEAHAIPAADRR